jgi:hypothetical protein
MSEIVKCPNGHVALVGKKKLLGLRVFFCGQCDPPRKNVERSPHWVFCGPGHEEQLLGFAEKIVSEEKRLKEFLEADSSSNWFNYSTQYGG